MRQSVRRVAVGAVSVAAAAGAVAGGAFFASLTSRDEPVTAPPVPGKSTSVPAESPVSGAPSAPEADGGALPTGTPMAPAETQAPAHTSAPEPAAGSSPGASPRPAVTPLDASATAAPVADAATVSRVRAACVRQLQQDEAASAGSATGRYTVDSVEFDGPVTRSARAAAYETAMTVGTTLADGSAAVTKRICRLQDLPGGVQWLPVP